MAEACFGKMGFSDSRWKRITTELQNSSLPNSATGSSALYPDSSGQVYSVGIGWVVGFTVSHASCSLGKDIHSLSDAELILRTEGRRAHVRTRCIGPLNTSSRWRNVEWDQCDAATTQRWAIQTTIRHECSNSSYSSRSFFHWYRIGLWSAVGASFSSRGCSQAF